MRCSVVGEAPRSCVASQAARPKSESNRKKEVCNRQQMTRIRFLAHDLPTLSDSCWLTLAITLVS